MKSITIKGKLRGGLAVLDVDLTYINKHKKHPIECTYEFPIDQATLVNKLVAKIEDREIVTKVKEKQVAQETFEDGIAGGKTAVVAQLESQQYLQIKLGNLGP